MEARAALWTFGGVIVAFKAWIVFLIILNQPDWQAIEMMIALHWPFLLLPFFLIAAPVAYWIRLLRVRAKRRRLQWEEWHVSDEELPVERSRR